MQMTFLAELKQTFMDSMGYETLVFESLDQKLNDNTKYLMCVRFPNWNHRRIEVGEVGFVEVNEIVAGESKWFDGTKMIPYNYDGVQFIKFIEKKDVKKMEYIMLSYLIN